MDIKEIDKVAKEHIVIMCGENGEGITYGLHPFTLEAMNQACSPQVYLSMRSQTETERAAQRRCWEHVLRIFVGEASFERGAVTTKVLFHFPQTGETFELQNYN